MSTEARQEDVSRHEDELKDIRDRLQQLRSDITSIRQAVDESSRVANRLTERVPENLSTRLVTVELDLERLIKDVDTEYVARTEFEVMKVEHTQIKNLMWGFVGLVMMSVVGALLTMVVHNASLFGK